ncbi:MAG: ATP-binding protein [Pontibacterium sp.]
MAAKPDLGENLPAESEDAWLSVIQKMDEAYADLVQSQVEVEQKNTQLEEAKSFSDSIERSMSDVLIVCDTDGTIRRVNHALEVLTGRVKDDLVGTSLSDLATEGSKAVLESCRQQLRLSSVRDLEVSLCGLNGAVPLAINASPRNNHRGRLVGMVLVGRPLGELQTAYKELNEAHAELKLAQERLVQSEKMASLGRLVAGVAHELNNPISFVYGNMHALQRYTEKLTTYFNAVGEQRSRDELRAMREQLRLDKAIRDLHSLVDGTMEGADRVREIVNDLRQFSSSQASEKAEFDLAHVITTSLHWVTKESKTPIDVELQVPEKLTAFGHAGQVHQVMVNIYQNALDAMADQPEKQLKVSAKCINHVIVVDVIDSGPGLDPSLITRVFDPFFTTKPVGQGTGLGLAISYGIASEHDGSLTIDNHPLGGAWVSLTLPSVSPKEAEK